ncbi:hypothetical protein [Peterkaempfera sp. SMS 1(5)a]|uniref:hypothetical protein n=1 Tax=Peterkaempfera podocarpi TaxID=3232308 RepID=UPI00366C3E6D
MAIWSRTSKTPQDTQHHLDGEVSKWQGIAEGRRMEASATDNPAEAARLRRKAKDADGKARDAAKVARRSRWGL